MLLRWFRLTSFSFKIVIEITVMSAKHFMVSELLLAMSILYWSHALGGSTGNDQTLKWDKSAINKLDISPSYVVIIDQSDAGLQRLPSFPGFKPRVTKY